MIFPSAAERDFVGKASGAIEGGRQTLERPSEYLPKMIDRSSIGWKVTIAA